MSRIEAHKQAEAEQHPADGADVRPDKQCRQDVAAALGFPCGGNYAWSYLLQQIKDAVSVAEQQPDVAQMVEALEAHIERIERINIQASMFFKAWDTGLIQDELETLRSAIKATTTAKKGGRGSDG